MNPRIIISGNLTGFTNFYASPNTNAVYLEENFDFDFRNYITFLDTGDKVYSISFAKKIISFSLITRILDSFRRPGILVISVILPKDMNIANVSDLNSKDAIYKLLNDINNKFYEKNFVTGMLNQNASVLMQDYYSEILSNYKLVQRNNIRQINLNITNGKCGYIASNEANIPLYLYSPYRRNYDGYNHIFFGEKAPQNINEEPQEVVMYHVYITNNKMTLPSLVKLTDKIYTLNPALGEISFDQNFTYEEVLQGKAGSQIHILTNNDTLEITYRFKEEEKTINFNFEDKGKIIPLSLICPIIEDTNGERYNLSSESFKFIGKELYGCKTIKSTNPKYIIRSESSNIDLQRLSDGATCHIQVENASILNVRFNAPYNVNKTIKITRKNSRQSYTFKNITDCINKIVPGNLDEWDYTLESNEYETKTGRLDSIHGIILKPKNKINKVNTITKNDTNNAIVKHVDKITLTGKRRKKEENELNIKKVLLIIIPILVILMYIIIGLQFSWWPWTHKGEDRNISKKTEQYIDSMKVRIVLEDFGGDVISDNNYKILMDNNSSIISIESKYNKDSITYHFYDAGNKIYQIRANKGCTDTITYTVAFNSHIIGENSIKFDGGDDIKERKIKLNVQTSALLLYKSLLNTPNTEIITKKQEGLYNKCISLDSNNPDFMDALKILYKSKIPTGNPPISNTLDSLNLTIEKLNQYTPKSVKEEKRVNALKAVLDYLQNSDTEITNINEHIGNLSNRKIIISIKNDSLTISQTDIVNELIEYSKDNRINTIRPMIKKTNTPITLELFYKTIKEFES